METISAIFGFLGKVTGLWAQRDAEKNAAPVQAAAKAKQEQGELDKTNQAVAGKDTNEIRDELSEN